MEVINHHTFMQVKMRVHTQNRRASHSKLQKVCSSKNTILLHIHKRLVYFDLQIHHYPKQHFAYPLDKNAWFNIMTWCRAKTDASDCSPLFSHYNLPNIWSYFREYKTALLLQHQTSKFAKN